MTLKTEYRNAWGENKTLELSELHIKCLRFHKDGTQKSDSQFTYIYPWLSLAGLLRWNTPRNCAVVTEKGLAVLDRIKRENTEIAMKMIAMITGKDGCKIAHDSFEREENKLHVMSVLHGDRADYWNLMGCLSRGNALHAETLIEQHIIEWEHS